ncbi:MAG: ATP-binding protein [Muribaculaceae bacterium]
MAEIKRILQDEILRRIKPQKVMLLFGARRVGKTVLLRQIVNSWPGKTLVLNGESIDTARLLSERTVANYRNLFQGVGLLAIDEAQHIPEIGLKLKLMVDEVPGLAVIATGSSSFDLQNQAGEPLVGRSTRFMLTPLAVEEYAATESGFETEANTEHRIIYGNYPELLALDSDRDRLEYLEDVVNSYLLRDILMVNDVKNSQKIHDLLRLIAWQVGSEVSYEELSRRLALSRNTVERYLNLLEQVFVIFRLGGYSKNLRREVAKASKWYFQDTGIRNAIIRDFRPLADRPEAERGGLWENFIISERIKRNFNHRLGLNFYFWRTYDSQEIDLLEDDGINLAAFEIKAGTKAPKPPRAFAEAYPDASFNVVNRTNYLSFVR